MSGGGCVGIVICTCCIGVVVLFIVVVMVDACDSVVVTDCSDIVESISSSSAMAMLIGLGPIDDSRECRSGDENVAIDGSGTCCLTDALG